MLSSFVYTTPIGKLIIFDNGKAITRLDFCENKNNTTESCCQNKETALLKSAAAQLREYFAGQRTSFDLPLEPAGTDFQKAVWRALVGIPYGQTKSYKDIALAAGCPKGYRAVGMANNKNPIAIIIPCHRVIGSNGKLVGYAGGLDIKEKLLKLEQACV